MEVIIRKSSKSVCILMLLVMLLGVFLVPATKASVSTNSGAIDISAMDNAEKEELLKYIDIESEK